MTLKRNSRFNLRNSRAIPSRSPVLNWIISGGAEKRAAKSISNYTNTWQTPLYSEFVHQTMICGDDYFVDCQLEPDDYLLATIELILVGAIWILGLQVARQVMGKRKMHWQARDLSGGGRELGRTLHQTFVFIFPTSINSLQFTCNLSQFLVKITRKSNQIQSTNRDERKTG